MKLYSMTVVLKDYEFEVTYDYFPADYPYPEEIIIVSFDRLPMLHLDNFTTIRDFEDDVKQLIKERQTHHA